jgi:hypothetical protein
MCVILIRTVPVLSELVISLYLELFEEFHRHLNSSVNGTLLRFFYVVLVRTNLIIIFWMTFLKNYPGNLITNSF